MKNVFENLNTLHQALLLGTKPEQLKKLGFVHSYQNGVLAVDQKGPGKGSKLVPFRLYLFPDEEEHMLHLRVLGNKETQPADVKISADFAKNIINLRSNGGIRDAEAGQCQGRPNAQSPK